MAEHPIAYYITPHGHGHAARSCDILCALHRLAPRQPLILVTEVDEAFLRSRLPADAPLAIRRAAFDVGLVQRDSVRADLEASRSALAGLLSRWPPLVREETTWLGREGIGLVVADIPAIPLEAAAAAGIPRVAVGNFSWNWIYEQHAGAAATWREAARAYAAGYARSDLLLRLPFHEPMAAFGHIEDLPVIATPGRARRAELAEATGAPTGARWVLLSFGTLAWPREALARLSALDGYAFFTVRPLAWEAPRFHALDAHRFPFTDVLASVDLVLTKPGFGIVSECVVNRKPMVYVERDDFGEYAVLEAAIRRYLRCARVTQRQLYAGALHEAFETTLAAPAPRESAPAGGAEIAAGRLLERLKAR